jgi:hypothetical protein
VVEKLILTTSLCSSNILFGSTEVRVPALPEYVRASDTSLITRHVHFLNGIGFVVVSLKGGDVAALVESDVLTIPFE